MNERTKLAAAILQDGFIEEKLQNHFPWAHITGFLKMDDEIVIWNRKMGYHAWIKAYWEPLDKPRSEWKYYYNLLDLNSLPTIPVKKGGSAQIDALLTEIEKRFDRCCDSLNAEAGKEKTK